MNFQDEYRCPKCGSLVDIKIIEFYVYENLHKRYEVDDCENCGFKFTYVMG